MVSIHQIFFGKKIYFKKLQYQTILFPYKLCVTEKRTYVDKFKSSNGFVVNTP